ncbi:hypothetical protein H4219_006121 [Mycoemilia scoparia]|uniref:Uncharacterized protein n=1 Tax=Mycoemilia scoparia TaxID=417184 RepID=A0A9W7ZQR8_9FUNG|nr:hypothetical protein H4219_006121 [Mycoemilia scoparia]
MTTPEVPHGENRRDTFGRIQLVNNQAEDNNSSTDDTSNSHTQSSNRDTFGYRDNDVGNIGQGMSEIGLNNLEAKVIVKDGKGDIRLKRECMVYRNDSNSEIKVYYLNGDSDGDTSSV